MPELPEVERLAAELRPHVVGHVVERVAGRQRGFLRPAADEATALLRGRIDRVDRCAKQLVLHGERACAWLHLGLGGEVRLGAAADADQATGAIVLDDGSALVIDKVFMGHIHVRTPAESRVYRATFGPDPLDPAFDAAALGKILDARPRAALKAVLVDQSRLAGIGNLYSDEALHEARLHPLRKAGSLTDAEVRRLHEALRAVLHAALDAGGEEGYTGLDGTPGHYRAAIHHRDRCTRCGQQTIELRVGGRVTTVCPTCQPEPGGARDA